MLSWPSPQAAGKPAPAEMVIKSALVSKLIILRPPRSAARAAAGLDGLHRGAPRSLAGAGEKSRVVGSEKPPSPSPSVLGVTETSWALGSGEKRSGTGDFGGTFLQPALYPPESQP